jgi:hypothetical protein
MNLTQLMTEASSEDRLGPSTVDVDRIVAGERRAAARRRFGAAGTAAAVVVGLAFGVPAALGGHSPTKPLRQPAAGARPSLSVAGPIPGVSAAQARQILRECRAAIRKPGPIVLYNSATDKAGTTSLIVGPYGFGTCGTPTVIHRARYQALPTEWLPGPIVIDSASAAGDGSWVEITGRVAPGVTHVTVTFRGEVAEADAVNGTYIARFVRPAGSKAPDVMDQIARAYDANGSWVGDADYAALTECYTDPQGKVVGGPPGDPATCKQAIRWRP